MTSYQVSFVISLCIIGCEIMCTSAPRGFRGKVSGSFPEDCEDRMNNLAEQPMVDVDTQQLARWFGTRTRVARVGAEYPNLLDHS